ncbi:hypothetical protein ACFO0N_08660 [Halobium salinum]|uniref:Uncharacterized protein n=1 Tax=Halobium salinum TaxID=1364940 RepID=A0ABD5PAX2_9EURY|nr:hypothetical protein [Halobium salinum]
MTLFSSSRDDGTESTADADESANAKTAEKAAKKAKQAKRSEGEPESTGGDAALGAAIASVGLSLYTYYVQGDKEQGVFIGLWAPTILGFATYLKQKSTEERLENSLLGGSAARRLKKLL